MQEPEDLSEADELNSVKTPALLFLHGVGQTIRTDAWLDGLNGARAAAGREPLEISSNQVIAPDYVEFLKTTPSSKTAGPRRTQQPDIDSAEHRLKRRTAYARCQRAASDRSPSDPTRPGLGNVGDATADQVQRVFPRVNDLSDVSKYLKNDSVRHMVLQRILSSVGQRRELIIVAHSLGSVIGMDLLGHLPPTWRVRRFITIGSPAGFASLQGLHPERKLKLADAFPYEQVDSWLNFHSPWDFVTGGLGVSRLFPHAHDVRVQLLPRTAQGAATYLRHPTLERPSRTSSSRRRRAPRQPVAATK